VTHLAGQVEDHLVAAHEIVHRALLADVGDVDVHAVGDAVDIEQVAAVVVDERIDENKVTYQFCNQIMGSPSCWLLQHGAWLNRVHAHRLPIICRDE